MKSNQLAVKECKLPDWKLQWLVLMTVFSYSHTSTLDMFVYESRFDFFIKNKIWICAISQKKKQIALMGFFGTFILGFLYR